MRYIDVKFSFVGFLFPLPTLADFTNRYKLKGRRGLCLEGKGERLPCVESEGKYECVFSGHYPNVLLFLIYQPKESFVHFLLRTGPDLSS